MKKKYKKILASLILMLTLTLCICFSYGFYKSVKDNNEEAIVLTDEYLSVNYLDGRSFDIKELKPNDVVAKKISVTNVNTLTSYLTISLMDVNKSSDNLNLTVYDHENNIVYDKTITNIDTIIVKGVDLPAGQTLSYTLMVKNNGSESSSFYANILAYKEVVKQASNTFKDTLLKNNEVKDYSISLVSNISEDDEGLVKTADDMGDTYIFRGNVLNNNVNFSNFNWKILRINGDSTIRLVLTDVLDNQVAYNDDVEETEDYTSKLKFDNSKIKGELEKFLSTNLQENSKYIVESTFCEDTTTFKEENNIIYLNPYNRAFVDNTPTLTCMGNKIKSKIGLLTVDEIVLAGAYQKNSNTKYYLYNQAINNGYWTMSGSQILKNNNAVDAISVNKDGSLNYERKISTPLSIRPVINLDSNTIVSGDGSLDNPYTIK